VCCHGGDPEDLGSTPIRTLSLALASPQTEHWRGSRSRAGRQLRSVRGGRLASLVEDDRLPSVATLWSGSQARDEVLDDLLCEAGIEWRCSQQPAVEYGAE
jgi:hypothetical protein